MLPKSCDVIFYKEIKYQAVVHLVVQLLVIIVILYSSMPYMS